MPNISLESFKGNLFDICRPNRFMISITSEMDFGFGDEDYYFVKGASIPGKTLGEIELNWQGHKYKVAGDPSFNDVTVTILNNMTEGSENVRDKFENWFHTISDDPANIRAVHSDYKCTVNIHQLDGQGNVYKTYNLINAHPKELGDIELSMDSSDAVEEFTVVFSYSYFEIEGGSATGDSGQTAGNVSTLV